MANPNKLNISALDFDLLKDSIKTFLQSQDQFTDYNFEGAGLTVLLNILAYNTHYMSYYLNMIANEMYLDSADRRDSVVSIAKDLNYVPRSRKSSTAVVNLLITPPGSPPAPATITIDRYTKFNSSLDGISYNFITDRAVTASLNEGSYLVSNLTLKEGMAYTYKYVVNTSTAQRFIIPNAGIDTGSLVVRVQESSENSLLTTYILADDINELNGLSKVFFLQEIEESKYEVYFGDDIIGRKLVDGNIVYIDYISCNGDDPNYCNIFVPSGHVAGYEDVEVETVTAAFGGAEREDQESIRFSAPKNYETQNRAVTVGDYKVILARDYPNVDSVAVWGGENNNPPQYGKVFLSLKPVSGYVITETTKQTIVREILKKRNIVSIIPVIIDPEYIFLKVSTLVKYDADSTTQTADDIKTLIINKIQTFANTEIGKFDRVFRYSKLSRFIDDADPAITNNLTTIQMQKRFEPRLNVTDQYTLQFANAIIPGTLISNAFVDTLDPSFVSGDRYFLDDDLTTGIIRTYKFIGTVKKYTKTNAGTIDYSTGIVTLTSFRPQDVIDSEKEMRITVKPQVNDVVPVRNNIIIVEDADITVTTEINSPVLV